MALERVTELVKQAASDGGILSALQDDPARMREPLQLSEEHVRALMSAGSFSTVRQAMTTSRSDDAAAVEGSVMQVGSLLPPEGSGFPGSSELPPGIGTPNAPSQPKPTPTGQSGPKSPPQTQPSNPRPAPALPGAAPRPGGSPSTAPPKSTPQGAGVPTKASGGVPTMQGATPAGQSAPQPPVSTAATPIAAPEGSGAQGQPGGSPGHPGQAPPPAVNGPVPRQAPQSYQTLSVSSPRTTGATACCPCETAMLAIVAQASTTAQTTITALTAIAGLN